MARRLPKDEVKILRGYGINSKLARMPRLAEFVFSRGERTGQIKKTVKMVNGFPQVGRFYLKNGLSFVQKINGMRGNRETLFTTELT